MRFRSGDAMPGPLSHLIHTHDLRLIPVAAVICGLAAITVFLILEQARAGPQRRAAWVTLAGIVCGTGTWATHFIAMLAYDPGVPVRYDAVLTFVSMLAAVLITGAGWWLSLRSGRHAAMVGGFTVAAGICTMHYIGMAAVNLPGTIRWSGSLVALSLVACASLTIGAVRAQRRNSSAVPWRPAIYLVIAICTLHFVAMDAATVEADPGGSVPETLLDRNGLLALVVAGSLLIVSLGFFVVLFGRVLEREKAAAEISHLAYHDALTGLANRSAFEHQLARRLDDGAGRNTPVALLAIDLDGFKAVNDVHGHPAGDQLLASVAARLRSAVLGDELIARVGGDEFMVVQHAGAQPGDVADLAARIIAALEDPFALAGATVSIGASAGIAVYPDDALSAQDLTRKADVALYSAKRAGRGLACFYDSAVEAGLHRRRTLEANLPLAIRRGELAVVYQPIGELASGRIGGFEALLRWSHPEFGCVQPEAFIAIAEEKALITELGTWVLREACRQAAAWRAPLIVCVNFSPVQFLQPDLARTVAGILAETGLDPHRLEIEVTENVLLSKPEQALGIFAELKALGARISLDDFGTGFSSLSYFRMFRFDKVKIDRSFVADLGRDTAREIVRSVIELSRNLGITVVAEGVETEAQRDILKQLRCDQIQGFLLGCPGPIEQFTALIGEPGAARTRAA
ncbi:MAG TPA: EAL domain-containing protein [Sphingomicrobium sp.]|nr:EAL domain-containing protein [Sphingomicrobium sp.]